MSDLLNEKADETVDEKVTETLSLAASLFNKNSDFYKSLLKKVEAEEIEAHISGPIRSALYTFISLMEDYLTSKCESPIEQMMAIALYSYATSMSSYMVVSIKPQEKIDCSGKIFRVDFLLEVFRVIRFKNANKVININIVVECDGHDYHERTKEQAQRDKERDRILQAHRYYVLRFTGSEIYKDPYDCADKVFEFIIKLTDSMIDTEKQGDDLYG